MQLGLRQREVRRFRARAFLARVCFFGWFICSLCAAEGSGVVTNCSLGDLLSALQGGGLVTLSCGGTITLTNTITITNNTVLDGTRTNAILSGNNTVRIFNIASNVDFTILNLTLANGSVVGNAGSNGLNGADSSGVGGDGSNGSNGANAVGGTIYNAGRLTLANCTLQSCSVAGGVGGNGGNGGNGDYQGGNGGNGGLGGNALGGAIYNLGQLSLSNSTVSGCSASAGNGGAGGTNGTGLFPGHIGSGGAGGQGSGAGVYSLGSATIVGCTFSSSTACGGNSRAAGHSSNGGLGGTGPNGGDSLGAGVCNLGALVLINCTFSTNTVTAGNGGNGGPGDWQGGNGGNGGSGSGGGLYNKGSAAVTNCTFAGGSATGGTNGLAGPGGLFGPGSDGAPGPSHGGNIATDAGSFYLANSIIAYGRNGGNGYGSVSDSGYNISSDNSLSLRAAGSRTNTDPQLGVLNDNGGPTPTFALLASSPAINSANPSNFPATDQRGVTRPQGARGDVGAYELEGAPVISSQPTNMTVVPGTPAGFAITASGLTPLFYQWCLNGSAIPGATSTNYSIASVQFTNAGNYSVTVSNVVGSITSSNTLLKVLVSPSMAEPVLSNGAFTVSFLSQVGAIYTLEYKRDLGDAEWTPLVVTDGNGNLVQMIDFAASDATRFYRIRVN